MQQELETLINLSKKEFVTEDEKQAILVLISLVLEDKPSKKGKYTDDDMKLAIWMGERVNKIRGREKKHPLESWANTIRLMRESDGIQLSEIGATFDWANKHHFWHKNILSPDKLRKQFDRLRLDMDDKIQPKGEVSPSEEFRQHLLSQGKEVKF